MSYEIEGRWGKVYFYENDEYVGKSLAAYGEYNPDESEFLIDLAGKPQEGVVLDIGANFGCLGQALEWAGHTVISFEPQPDIFQMLRQNVKGECHNTALGATNCTAQMPKMPENVNANYGGISLGTSGPDGSLEVQVRTIDSYNFQNVYLMKVDVEGYEEQVLRGAEQTIRRCKPLLYIEDDRQEKSQSLRAFLAYLGYSIEEHRPLLYREQNFFGLKRNIWGKAYASYNIVCRPGAVPTQNLIMIDVPKNLAEMTAKKDFKGVLEMFDIVQQHSDQKDIRMQMSIQVNKGIAWSKLFDYERMEACYQKAVEYADSLGTAEGMESRYYLAIAQLHNGKIQPGFFNYAFRWTSPDMQPHMQSMLSKGVPYVGSWDELHGRRVFVSGEQGFGDELMFSRALVEASKITASMFKLTPEPLKEFMAFNCPGTQMVPEKLSTLPKGFIKDNYDCIITIGDLFRLYVLKYGKLPPTPHYHAQRPVQINSKLPRIGLVYSPGKMGDSTVERTINPSMFNRFSKEYDWYSFQIGPPARLGVDLSISIKTFMDTANLLEGMDCAITCDTAFAHLALNMHKPTLLVYDTYVDWRFKVNLYPEVQLLSTNDQSFGRKLRQFVSGATALD